MATNLNLIERSSKYVDQLAKMGLTPQEGTSLFKILTGYDPVAGQADTNIIDAVFASGFHKTSMALDYGFDSNAAFSYAKNLDPAVLNQLAQKVGLNGDQFLSKIATSALSEVGGYNKLYSLSGPIADYIKQNETYFKGVTAGGGSVPADSGASGTVDFTTPVTGFQFKDSAAYKALSPDMQSLVDLGFNVYLKGGEADATVFADSLSKAQALADPYARAQLGLFKATFLNQIAEKSSDYKFKYDTLQKTRDELAQDLKDSKEYLTLNEQADMATALRGYDDDILTIADQAAEKGLTFASGARSRSLAEEKRTAQYQDVVQSSSREFNFRIKELQLQADRGDANAKQQLDQLLANKTFDLTTIGQNATKVLGTAGATDLNIDGYTAPTGVLGDVEQERRKSILDIAEKGLI